MKVYSRAGALSSSSEALTNSQLGDKIAWRPEGSIIASSVRDLLKDRLNIIFFERNGLQRYGFDLNVIDSIVNIWGLAWNSDSSILAVGVEKRNKSGSSDHTHQSRYAGEFCVQNYQSDLKPSFVSHSPFFYPYTQCSFGPGITIIGT